jgi:hypothetical protein
MISFLIKNRKNGSVAYVIALAVRSKNYREVVFLESDFYANHAFFPSSHASEETKLGVISTIELHWRSGITSGEIGCPM